MKKEILMNELRRISDVYFDNENFICAGIINRAIDVIEDYDEAMSNTNLNNKKTQNGKGEEI